MSSQQTFKALPAEFLDNLFEGFEPGTSLLAEVRAFFGDKLAESLPRYNTTPSQHKNACVKSPT
ncbi:MAG: hypothetical protein ABWZ57_15890 [Mesorhizobium sp.]|jgi:hypothetical protein